MARGSSPRVRRLAALAVLVVIAATTTTSATAAPDGTKLWVKRYDGPSNGFDRAWGLAVSPDGSRIVVTGESYNATDGYDFATVAYDASTGGQLWARRYDGPGNASDGALAVSVSPDGSMVFVTGGSDGTSTGRDFATVAYDGATGATIWKRRYHGDGASFDYATALGVNPDGTAVYVTGRSDGTNGLNFYTIAYDASTGAKLWARRRGSSYGQSFALKVSPDGSQVFVTGAADGSATLDDFVTIAYDAVSGVRQWSGRYNGPANDSDFARALAVSPDGSQVFVAGESAGSGSGRDYATVAYDAATGTESWVRRYNGPGNGNDHASAIDVSPDGSQVYVTGDSYGTTTFNDYATIAYEAANGTKVWTKRYDASGNGDGAYAIGVSPDGAVIVTGGSIGGATVDDYATIAYDGSTGSRLWLKRYDGPASGADDALAIGLSPDGTRAFITGVSGGTGSDDYATVAYGGA